MAITRAIITPLTAQIICRIYSVETNTPEEVTPEEYTNNIPNTIRIMAAKSKEKSISKKSRILIIPGVLVWA
jgi:hypothetical protein